MPDEHVVFISSTSVDLVDCRNSVISAIHDLGWKTTSMEHFGAQPTLPLDTCLSELRQASIYVGILAWRYGTISLEHDCSYTELEYNEAVRLGLPIYGFLLDEEAPWPVKHIDNDRTRIQNLRERWTSKHTVAFFTNQDDLAKQVIPAIIKTNDLTETDRTTLLTSDITKEVSQHKEAHAFNVSKTRTLHDFCVNLSLTPKNGLPTQLLSGHIVFEDHSHGKTISSECCERIYDEQRLLSFLPHDFTLLTLLPSYKESGINELYNWNSDSIFEDIRLSERKLPEEVTVRSLSLGPLIDHLLQHLDHNSQSIRAPSDDVGAAFELLDRVNDLLTFIHSTFPHSFEEGARSAQSLSLCFQKVTPEALIKTLGNWCITADAGAGKTTLARRVTTAAISSGINAVYFPCSFAHSPGTLRSHIVRYLKHISPSSSDAHIESYIASSPLIIIDGCDEAGIAREELSSSIAKFASPSKTRGFGKRTTFDIPPQLKPAFTIDVDESTITLHRLLHPLELDMIDKRNKPAARKHIQTLQSRLIKDQKCVIMTMRESTNLTIPTAFSAISILPFDDQQLDIFFQKWFTHDQNSYRSVTTFLHSHTWVRDVCRMPMVATIVATLYENGIDLPRSRTDIYEKRFDFLLKHWDEEKGINRNNIHHKDKLRLLSHLAFQLHLEKRRTFSKKDIRSSWSPQLAKIYPQITVDQIIRELHETNDVISPEGDGAWSLGHLSYQEYLAAIAFVNLQHGSKTKAIIKDSWWHKVLIFFCGITGDASIVSEAIQDIDTSFPEANDLVIEIEKEARYTSNDSMNLMRDIATEHSTRDFMSDDDDWSPANSRTIFAPEDELEWDYDSHLEE